MMDAAAHRNFDAALRLLLLRRASRSHAPARSTVPPTQLPDGRPAFRGVPHIANMRPWLQKLGYGDDKIETLRIIHVAGTKGKGSTCAYIEAFLRQHGRRTGYPKKTGLYTSPHLLRVNERIRINSIPLTDEHFAQAFFEVSETLGITPEGPGPRYLQILCLMAFHVFLKEGVDVAILETHHGGEFDVTNIVKYPSVTVITHIGMDHKQELGPTIKNIAWHKAGIFKRGAAAISCQQDLDVTEVLDQRAKEKGVTLEYVDPELQRSDFCLPIRAQQQNAGLARVAADSFLRKTTNRTLNKCDIKSGLQAFSWPGRFQIEKRNNLAWCLDCAHTSCSAEEAALWFNNLVFGIGRPSVKRILVFGLNSDRHDGLGTLCSLADSLREGITNAIFTSDAGKVNEPRLQELRITWQARSPETQVEIIEDSEEAIKRAEILAGESEAFILVTGSFFLVRSANLLLEKA